MSSDYFTGSAVFEAASELFEIDRWPSEQKDLDDYGTAQVDVLCTRFEPLGVPPMVSYQWLQRFDSWNCFCCTAVQISGVDFKAEFTLLKVKVLQRPQLRKCDSLVALAVALHADRSDTEDLPTLLRVIDWILAIPLSNAGRFENMTLIHT